MQYKFINPEVEARKKLITWDYGGKNVYLILLQLSDSDTAKIQKIKMCESEDIES